MIDVLFESPPPAERQLVLTGYSLIRLAGDTIRAVAPAERRAEGEPGPTAIVHTADGGLALVPIEAPIEIVLAVRDAAGWHVNGFEGPTFAEVRFVTHDHLDEIARTTPGALEAAGRRAAADPEYLAHRLGAYQRAEGLTDQALMERLGCNAARLAQLRLNPAIRDDHLEADCRALAERYKLNAAALEAALRE